MEVGFNRELPADDRALDVGCSFVDRAHLHIAIDALDREVVEVAAAVDLDGAGADLLGHLRREQLGPRRFLQAGLAGIAQSRGVQHHQLGGLQRSRHVGQAEADGLVFDDRLAESATFLGIGEGGVIGGARHADRLGRDTDAPAFEVTQGDLEALTFLTQHLAG